MQREKPPKGSTKKLKRQSSDQNKEDSEDDDQYQDSFVVDDDQVQEEGDPYYHRRKFEHQLQNSGEKLKVKTQKPKANKIKKQGRKRKGHSFDQDDLELVDEANNLVRLRKNWELRESQDQEELLDKKNEKLQQNSQRKNRSQKLKALPKNQLPFHELSSGSEQSQEFSDQYSDKMPKFQEIEEVQRDPFDTKRGLSQNHKEIIETDLPQRYLHLLKKNITGNRKDLAQVRQYFDSNDILLEVNWIFRRLKQEGSLLQQNYDQQQYKQKIVHIMQSYHWEHLDTMYIFYYRKMFFKDYVNLQLLWKIIELDEYWHNFRQRKEKIIDFVNNSLTSFTKVPKSLQIMAKQLLDVRQLKYFQDYQRFKSARYAMYTFIKKEQDPNSKNQKKKGKRKLTQKVDFITQMAERGIIDQLQSSHIVLEPYQFCNNIIKGRQEIKPKSPEHQPKEQFQRYLATSDPQSDKMKYPLLMGENRYKTIIKYLTFELFSFPQLKKILKNKYYKKLVITTHPTSKGNQDIDLYSIFFPVKRIKDKPVSTLKREVWVLARQAERLGHIRIELKFQWEKQLLSNNQRSAMIDHDTVCDELIYQYYDTIPSKNLEIWNLFRKRIISNLLYEHYIPYFTQEIRQDLSRQGQKQIIAACCVNLKSQLSKGPYLHEGKPARVLALVVNETKLGIVCVDQDGKSILGFSVPVNNDFQVKSFASGEQLRQIVTQNKPDLLLIAASCKKAQILRNQIILQHFSCPCLYGEYHIPRLVAKKKIMQGLHEEQLITQAVSMARLKKNPLAEIVFLWSEKLLQNGVLSMNLHPFQKLVNQSSLKQSLQKVIIEMVNLVGLQINQIKNNKHLHCQVQFISGFGAIKAKQFLGKLSERNGQILSREIIGQMMTDQVVYRNCSPFFRVETSFHRSLFKQLDRNKKGEIVYQYESIHLLDMTRITMEWYKDVEQILRQNISSAKIAEIRMRKQFTKLSDSNILLLQMLKNTENIQGVSNWKISKNKDYDQQFIVGQLRDRFKDPREKPKQMQNNQIFYSLMRETPYTFKKFMIIPVKVISVKKHFLNVIQVQSGLFGSIKLQSNKSVEEYEKIYEKGAIIKTVLIGFQLGEKNKFSKDRGPKNQEQDLLRAEMSLEFPHKDSEQSELGRHNCMKLCFPWIVKQLHPPIDLDKDRFDLRREDRPVLQNIEDKKTEQKANNQNKTYRKQQRKVYHNKFKNISIQAAIQMMKTAVDGDYVIRPSSQGPDYLTITWRFYGKVLVHIKIRCEQKSATNMNMVYRIEDRDNISYDNLNDIIQKRIKPINLLVQDVIHNRKFFNKNISDVENTIKGQRSANPSQLSFYLCASEDFPQYFLLIYEYKEKYLCKELIKVKSTGLSFHNKQFSSSNELILWFKDHYMESEYQKYVKNISPQPQGKK